MGSGKGTPEYWVCVVQPGLILFEMNGVSKSVAYDALRNAAYKLPIKTRFVSRNEETKVK